MFFLIFLINAGDVVREFLSFFFLFFLDFWFTTSENFRFRWSVRDFREMEKKKKKRYGKG